ncbi:MAG: 3-oxoacyl-[acyl-carrier-protein] synthase [Frankiales bacterium]|jgi:3-oxoacyl-[acyl-carrier-protein] synthase-3|nr:3-oxoacyl-[acyl-carrier-protein] synthase [Frankiales bacterium]MDX6275611.1 3-oxoacyl-[acyl-carrier-protein] synthase [Frankiales bacterium]
MTTGLRSAPRPAAAAVLGLGTHRPARVVSNAEVCEHIDSTDEWIRERSGIATRRYGGPEDSVVEMGAAAAAKALAAAGVDASQVDLVLVTTCSYPNELPSASSLVGHKLGVPLGAGAIDLNAACAGFCYGLSVAADAVRAGSARYVLVVGSERLTDMIDLTDRSMAFIFGDGAGAALVGPSDVEGIGPVAWATDSAAAPLITQRASWVEHRDNPTEYEAPYFQMDGPAVFRWTVTKLAPIAKQACEAAGISLDELKAFVPHQANLRIVEGVAKALRLPESVVLARDVIDNGNTSSASIPLALERLVERGEVVSGDPALLIGFGAGLTVAAQVVLVP